MIRICFVLAVLLSPAFAAIQAGAQWDVRTGGADTNGGFFDNTVSAPGTDWSVQDATHQAYTDLVIGATTTQVTSALHPFGAAHPGNGIKITGGAGCTTGWFEVLSVSGVTATLDRSAGTAASTCTANLGGGLVSFVTALAQVADLNVIHIATGTYSFSSQVSIPNLRVTLRGYSTAHNDYAAQATLTTASNINGFNYAGTSSRAWFDNLKITATSTNNHNAITTGSTADLLSVSNCYFSGWGYGAINGDAGDFAATIKTVYAYNTEFTNNGISQSKQCIKNSGNINVERCYFHGNYIDIGNGGGTGTLIQISHSIFTGWSVDASVFYGTGTTSLVLRHSVWYSTAHDAVSISGNVFLAADNCVFYGMTAKTALNMSSPGPIALLRNNAFGANGTNYSTAVVRSSPGEITLSADPFTSGSTGDFSLNSTAGGGASLKNAGYPLTPAGLAASTYDDVNALRHQDPAGSGGTKGYTFSLLLGSLAALGVVAMRRRL